MLFNDKETSLNSQVQTILFRSVTTVHVIYPVTVTKCRREVRARVTRHDVRHSISAVVEFGAVIWIGV